MYYNTIFFPDMQQVFLSHLNWITGRLDLINLNVISYHFMLIIKYKHEP